MPKITIITTIDHNVGDDFVREGIIYLLKRVLGEFQTELIHKHIPLTVRPEMEWFYTSGLSRILDRLPRCKGLFWSRVMDRLPVNYSTDKIHTCSLLVQSGAPVYWEDAHLNEWYYPLIRKRWMAKKYNVPFINIGAGTCQPYNSDGSDIITNAKCAQYIKELYRNCSITTLRDTLSKSILNKLGLEAPVIPCPSIFARDNLGILPNTPQYVALNFMPIGGHYRYDSGFLAQEWEDNFKQFYYSMKKQSPVLLVCHSAKEYEAAARIDPESNRFIGKTAKDYLEIYSKAKYFIGCRVHAAFATASFGRPGFVIGNDTRALMTSEIGLKSVLVNNATAEVLANAAFELEASRTDYSIAFNAIKEKALQEYIQVLSPLNNYFK